MTKPTKYLLIALGVSLLITTAYFGYKAMKIDNDRLYDDNDENLTPIKKRERIIDIEQNTKL